MVEKERPLLKKLPADIDPVLPLADQSNQSRVSENRLMNRRFCAWVGSLLGFLALSHASLGQSPPPPAAPPADAATTIPLGSQTAASLTGPMKDQISKFISEQFALLSGTDYSAQSTARKTIMAAVANGSQPAYYAWFITRWSATATSALPSAPLGVRLNIAIATATMATNAQSRDLEPLVRLLLADHEPSVVLWAVKASKPQVMQTIQTPNVTQSPLVIALVKAVSDHGNEDVVGGFIAQDGYKALNFPSVPGVADNLIKPKLQLLVPPILDILESRIKLHAAGPVQSPGVEREVSTFLAGQYLLVPVSVQKRMLQDLITLETYAGQRAPLYQNSKIELAQIREMIKYVTSAITVIDPPAASQLGWLLSPPPASTAAEMAAHSKTLAATVAATPSFSWITVPPAIPVIAPPPPPAPTTPAPPGGATPPK